MSKWRIWLLAVLAAPLVGFGLITLAWVIDRPDGASETVRNVVLAGRDVGQMNRAELAKVVADLDDAAGAARRAAAREAEEEAGIDLDPASLVWFSHWTPPPISPKRFGTHFFATAALAGDLVVTIDGGEIHDHAWMRPTEAMARRDAREIEHGERASRRLVAVVGHHGGRAIGGDGYFVRAVAGGKGAHDRRRREVDD